MRTGALGAALLALTLGSQGLAAQQPKPQMPHDSAHQGMAKGMDMQQQMRMMDSMNARLDSLVLRMNKASGNAKVTAMAGVINELVAQRRTMHAHMQQMMQSRGAMRGGHGHTMRSDA